MKYRDIEKNRIVALRDELFADPGGGMFSKAPRDFVLRDRSLNLSPAIRADALDYFKRNGISWWRDDGQQKLPTGHLLSSQVACVNHLFGLRNSQAGATALLRALDPAIESAEIIDDGYVEFEFIGERPYLKERSFSRGSHCTSVDAAMIGRRQSGERVIFLIEWKYTEEYDGADLYIPERALVYDALIRDSDGPFTGIEARDLYYEPFYQLMRQTLLGSELAKHGDHGCSAFMHVHVAPSENRDFHDYVTAPALKGATVAEAWKSVLKRPERFISTTPQKLLAPVLATSDCEWASPLKARYWTSGDD
jgi:hypothetical protein